MSSNITYWNNDAAGYDKRAKKSAKAYQMIIKLLKNEVSPEMSVLDIGTGTGEIPINISGNVKYIDAVDFSSEMIQVAKNKMEEKGIKNISFLIQNSNQMSYKDNSFDIILMTNLLHVVPNPENVIDEAKRLIKKDGKIIISSYLHNQNMISRFISNSMKKKGHPVERMFNRHSLCEFVNKCSLEIISKVNIKNIMPMMFIIARKQIH